MFKGVLSNRSFAFLQIQENQWEMEQTGTPVPEESQPTCLPMEGVVVGQGKTGLPLKQIMFVLVKKIIDLTGGYVNDDPSLSRILLFSFILSNNSPFLSAF